MLSRRNFAQMIGASAVIASLPRVAATQTAAAQTYIRLSSNENPFGPSPVALDAMRNAMALAARYPDDEAELLIAAIAKLHGVSDDQVVLGAGSGEILKVTAAAYTSASKRLVMADPTFEAIGHHARMAKAEVVKISLDAKFAHDIAKMAAVTNAGVIYVCNPNNPTASITPKQAIRSLLDSAPASTMILVDEAYHHYVESADYESVMPLVSSHPNLIVCRTFSKIFGMAGLRAGYAIAQPAVARVLRDQQAWDSTNVIALAGARASLGDTRHVIDGRKRNSDTRRMTLAQLDQLGFSTVPSEANFIMIDTRRPVRPIIESMRERGVWVGRLFPAMPQHLRVTIGTPQEMARFIDAFKSVVA